ncbi:hypothetical protein CN070_17135 [Sinorhizobium meliloti]|nr:hypothetical protein CN070_17135 [Sinorhizobium meliloti]
MNVIDSNKLRRGMRAENRTHFSSSRASRAAPRSRRVPCLAASIRLQLRRAYDPPGISPLRAQPCNPCRRR